MHTVFNIHSSSHNVALNSRFVSVGIFIYLFMSGHHSSNTLNATKNGISPAASENVRMLRADGGCSVKKCVLSLKSFKLPINNL